ncbi:MAG: hypothetical protein HC890_05515 [Chloroflexaceae bacterium]|nr:hypothetical protein [Chloroflexaceae bacterium]
MAKFSVWMPQGVLSEETETIATPGGELKFKVIATNPGAARFIVAYSEELNPAQLEDSATLFARIRDEIIKDTDFKFQGDRAITIPENHPGREFTLQNRQETITMRIFAIDRQIYLLGSEQATSDSPSPAAIAFFNSFKRL